MQPLINPLYGGKSACEVLSAVLGQPTRTTFEIVREHWGGEEKEWRRNVHDGVVRAGTTPSGASVPLTKGDSREAAGGRSAVQTSGLEIVFRPDPTIYDGRFANNAWLQELPKPLTKLVWDNAALLSPATAQRLNLENEDVIEIKVDGRAIRAPVWISPGHAAESITLFLGYGRTRAGSLGSNRGYNANSLRTTSAAWIAPSVDIRKTGERYTLVSTQTHQLMENRHIVRHAPVGDYSKDPDFAKQQVEPPPRDLTLYPEYLPEDYAWGMAIDLSTCIGCNACVMACQAENNILALARLRPAYRERCTGCESTLTTMAPSTTRRFFFNR
jgi:molybdopterin-containing oxidoreductase family iron-sulfur binding subunit